MGFSDAEIDRLEMAARLISPYAERHALRRIAVDLLDTYVGHHAGERIFQGQVQRGAVERIDAAILMADLRGFTSLSNSVRPRRMSSRPSTPGSNASPRRSMRTAVRY